MTFDNLWRFINARGSIITVQEYHELEYVFNLIKDCESYLEVGTAEGNSLYVLAHALKHNANITYIDWDENHTRIGRNEIIKLLKDYKITPIHGNTHDPRIVEAAMGKYDVVLIDAGHKFEDAIADARNYGPMATKYLIFHDINLPEVKEAFDLYQKETGLNAYIISNSESFGYGIMEIK